MISGTYEYLSFTCLVLYNRDKTGHIGEAHCTVNLRFHWFKHLDAAGLGRRHVGHILNSRIQSVPSLPSRTSVTQQRNFFQEELPLPQPLLHYHPPHLIYPPRVPLPSSPSHCVIKFQDSLIAQPRLTRPQQCLKASFR